MNKCTWGEYDLHVLEQMIEPESESQSLANPICQSILANMVKSLHERVVALEGIKDIEDRDTYEELLEKEHDSLALQCFAAESNSAIMMKMWRKEKREKRELQAKVDEFMAWAEENQRRVEWNDSWWSALILGDVLAKLRELGLMKEGD